MMNKIFINLTSGIEKLPPLLNKKIGIDFLYIQSTACEQKRWGFILQDLDYNFLLCLATGISCSIIDCSAHHKTSRAMWQGVEWIKYALSRRWLNKIYTPKVRGMNCEKYFNEQYNKLSKQTFKKVDYFKKFILTDNININIVCSQSKHHGDDIFFKEELKAYVDEVKDERLGIYL